jgi:NAD(P)H-nitrite reductase large subunit
MDSLLARKCQVEALIQPIGLKQILYATPGLLTGLDREKVEILYRSLKGVLKNKIPHFGSHIVCEAQGDDELTNLKICSIDRRWKVIPGTEKNIEADVLGISYGLRPSVDLSHMLGCKIYFDPILGYWRTLHDHMLESSLENVYVAGDNSQIRGYTAAEKQGQLAAISACTSLGITSIAKMDSQIRKLQKYLNRNAIFGKTLDNLSKPGPDIWDIVTDDCLICRCESISLADIKKASEEGLEGINDLKRRSRVGMGYCQGRYCGQIINEILWHFTGYKARREIFNPRIPMRPVSFETISGSDA